MRTLRMVGTLLLSAGLAGCGADDEPPAGDPGTAGTSPAASGTAAAEERTVTVGLQAPVSGFAAADGASAVAGAELGVEHLNSTEAVPGTTFELVVGDDQASADQGAVVASQLTSEEATAVVGASYSGPMRAAAPVYQEEGVPMCTAYAVHPEITQAGDLVFRIWPVADVEGEAVATYVSEELGAESVGVLNLDNDFGTSLATGFTEAFEAAGGQVAIARTGEVGQTDFRAALTEIAQADIDALFIAAYYTEGAQIVQQAQDLNLDVQLIGAGMDSPNFLSLAGDAAEGMVYLSTFNPEDERELVSQFVQAYEEKTGNEPDSIAASVFDCMLVLAAAMESAGADGVTGASILSTEVTGVTGPIALSDNGEVRTNVFFHRVEGGELTTVGEVNIGE